jgi:carboxyl-terminal processing protease
VQRRFAIAILVVAAAVAAAGADPVERRWWNSSALATPYRAELPEDERVAGLSRVWSEVKLNFANFDLVPQLDWDALFLQYLPKVRAARATRDYYDVLTELVARLHDGHTGVIPPRELWETTDRAPLLRLRAIAGKAIVTYVDAELARRVAVGDEIVAVNDTPAFAYARKNIAPYESASTPQDRESRMIADLLTRGDAGTRVEVALRDASGAKRTATLTRVPLSVARAKLPHRAAFEFRMLPGDVAYVALNSFDDDTAANEFDKHYAAILESRALILDVRDNGGGNGSVGFRVLAHLIDRAFVVDEWWTRQYRPLNRAHGVAQPTFGGRERIAPDTKAPRYTGRVLLLTSPRTFSAAEDFTEAFRVTKRGRIVGEATGGSTGQPLFVSLPGGGSVRICTKRDRYPGGGEWVGIGIKPDVRVAPTVEDFRAGRDTVLEHARALLE